MLVAEQRSTLLAVVCIAVLVVVAFWAALSGNNYTSLPPPITTTIPQPCQAGASDCGSTYNSYTGPIVTVDRIVRAHSGEIEAVSTALLTIITAGLVYIARAQYVTTRAQLRAYVFVKEGSITRKVNNIGQVVFSAHLNVRNFGLTPAYNFTTEHDIAILAAGNKDFTDLHNRSDRKSTIGPGAEVNCVPETDPISNQEEARH
jgi:hypothetical protein